MMDDTYIRASKFVSALQNSVQGSILWTRRPQDQNFNFLGPEDEC